MWEVEDDFDALLAEDIDLTRPEPALVGADGEKTLDGVVGDLRDLGVDSEILDLQRAVSFKSWGKLRNGRHT